MSTGTTLTKLMICPYFGEYPDWMPSWFANTERLREHGYEFLFDDDEDAFRQRVNDKLGIECPPMYGTGNIWDFRPALGALYAEEAKDYDFWGTTDFDCVYGRVERFYPDELLDKWDIVTDHWEYLCGPWTLFKNNAYINDRFRTAPGWREQMESAQGTGWMEREFTTTVNKTLNVNYKLNHEWKWPDQLRQEDDCLYHDRREIPFFHFRHTKTWPL